MRLNFEVLTCDICKKKMTDIYLDPFLKRYPICLDIGDRKHFVLEDVCDDCRNAIGEFVKKNLFVPDYKKINVTYDNEVLEEMKGDKPDEHNGQ